MLSNCGAESPLDCKQIKPVNPKVRADSLEKNPDAGENWGQEKGATKDKMVGWHHWLSRPEFEKTLGDSEGDASLACCSSWGRKEADIT